MDEKREHAADERACENGPKSRDRTCSSSRCSGSILLIVDHAKWRYWIVAHGALLLGLKLQIYCGLCLRTIGHFYRTRRPDHCNLRDGSVAAGSG